MSSWGIFRSKNRKNRLIYDANPDPPNDKDACNCAAEEALQQAEEPVAAEEVCSEQCDCCEADDICDEGCCEEACYDDAASGNAESSEQQGGGEHEYVSGC